MGSAIPTGTQAGIGIAVCAPAHREDLEALLDLVRSNVELESPCDFAERPVSPGRNRAAFMAHFGELEATLEAYDERVARVQAAPGSLWESLARSAAARGVGEPPFAVGPLVDRLAVLTVQRARRGQLEIPHELSLTRFTDTREGLAQVSIYMAGQRVASVACAVGEDPEALADSAQAALQGLFDEAQHSEQAREIDDARDALVALKQHLLGLLAERAAADAIAPADACPVCGCARES